MNTKLSSKSIYHRTNTLDNIKSILKNGFSPTYCHEVYILDGIQHDRYVPMICFSQLPISLSNKIMNTYGNFQIGISKTMAIKIGICPIMYIQSESPIAKILKNIMDKHKEMSVLVDDKKYWVNKNPFQKAIGGAMIYGMGSVSDNAIELLRYIKNNEGVLIRRDGTRYENHSFRDEHEWRFVPERLSKGFSNEIKWALNEHEYKNYREKGGKPLLTDIVIPCGNQLLKEIVVTNQLERKDLIEWFHTKPGIFIKDDQIQKVISKIKVITP